LRDQRPLCSELTTNDNKKQKIENLKVPIDVSVCSIGEMLIDSAQKKAEQRIPSARSNTMSQSAAKEIPYSVGKIEVTTPDFSYLQTARVWIMIPPEVQNSCRSPEANPLPLANLWWKHCSRLLLIPKTW